VCNLLLFAAKLSIGLFIRSISVVADAVNNLSDAGSSVISFVGVQLAKNRRPEHPFGHGRMEYVTAWSSPFWFCTWESPV
jgi:divalent metal cation (Fe/Co/Zn/Cd) transporter